MKNEAAIPDSGDLSRKIVAVAAGEAHTLALSGDGCVYSWGRGMFGRLGTGTESDELFPVKVQFGNSELKFVAVAAGAYHSLALAADGSVWSWGYNIYGQLGFDGNNSVVPHLINNFRNLEPDSPMKICAVEAGGMMSLAIDIHGALWIWGNCPQEFSGSTGCSFVSSFTPTPVWGFHGHTVVKVACGNEHTVALVSAGEKYEGGDDLVCYSWGINKHGQLGLGDRESRLYPQIIETFNKDSPWAVYDVTCGAFHTALLTRNKTPSESPECVCWTFGLGDNGQLGCGTTQSFLIPEPVKDLPRSINLVSVDCGLFHTSVVSSAGEVWSWGMEKGLGLCPDASFTGTDAGDAISPILISSNFLNPIQVACGAAHTVLVAHNGYKLLSWGRGKSGVLGNGNTVDCFAPSIALWPPRNAESKQEDSETATEEEKTDERLALAMEEMKLLQSKLSIMERYASILHGSIFGKPFEEQDIPESLRSSGTFDIAREWEKMLETADRGKLLRLESFYRSMISGVKDKLMKRRIQELVKECLLHPPKTGE